MGRCRDRRWRDLYDDYLGRIGRQVGVRMTEVPARDDGRLPPRLAKMPRTTHVVALQADGRRMDSTAFARHLQRLLARASRVVFLVGGAEGLPASVDEHVDESLSLSQLTLPHRLARLVLLEQIYRATTVMAGRPYHR